MKAAQTDKKLLPEARELADYHEHLRIIQDDYPSSDNEESSDRKKSEKDDESKIDTIAWHFGKIMETLGLDLNDDSLQGTPDRVAKMYVREVFQGLDPKNKPDVTLFENKYKYSHMLVERNIKVHSHCEHHFVPILGKAHVAYIPNGHVIGLSKINRIVDYYSRRPQVQERLTEQIAEELKKSLHTEDVAVVVDADHMCVVMRGIKDQDSATTTGSFHGKFQDKEVRSEFLNHVYQPR